MSSFVFDFHTHAFPERIATATMNKLSEIAATPYHGDGTLRAVGANLEESGADMSLVLNIATNPQKNAKINDCAAANDYFISGYEEFGRFVQFGSVHPDTPDVLSEIERIKSLGLRGVKFHPDYQGFCVDEDRLFPIYKKLSELGLIAVFNGGWDPYSPSLIHCTPESAVTVLKSFPNLKIVLAHLGGNIFDYEKSLNLLCGRYENLYLDTSFCNGHIKPDLLKMIIERQGADKVLFGSDYPWHTTEEELSLIRGLELKGDDEAKILGLNAIKLLNLPINV